MKILGIDYGDVRIGLAISDKNGRLARRFLTVENKSLESAILEIEKLIVGEIIEKIIVGLPVGFKVESEQGKKTNHFIIELKKKTKKPIIVVNEVLTSKMAQENLLSAGIRGKELKRVIDQEAARIILQEYLDKVSETKN